MNGPAWLGGTLALWLENHVANSIHELLGEVDKVKSVFVPSGELTNYCTE